MRVVSVRYEEPRRLVILDSREQGKIYIASLQSCEAVVPLGKIGADSSKCYLPPVGIYVDAYQEDNTLVFNYVELKDNVKYKGTFELHEGVAERQTQTP